MKKGGKYGGSTITGLLFEKETDIENLINSLRDYEVRKEKIANRKNEFLKIYYKSREVGMLLGKHRLYKDLLEPKEIDYEKIISKKLLPDEAIYVYDKKTIYIVEKKFQKCDGSVDEKLQTCDFKRKQYLKLLESLDLSVEYIYVLSDWFKKKKYKDSLQYIEEMRCKYFFEELPLVVIGLNQ